MDTTEHLRTVRQRTKMLTHTMFRMMESLDVTGDDVDWETVAKTRDALRVYLTAWDRSWDDYKTAAIMASLTYDETGAQ